MYQLIVTILLSLGFNLGEGNHFTMNESVAIKVKTDIRYSELGGDREFNRYVTIGDKPMEDIVVTDDDNPIDAE